VSFSGSAAQSRSTVSDHNSTPQINPHVSNIPKPSRAPAARLATWERIRRGDWGQIVGIILEAEKLDVVFVAVTFGRFSK
jgi:hypothetical protein